MSKYTIKNNYLYVINNFNKQKPYYEKLLIYNIIDDKIIFTKQFDKLPNYLLCDNFCVNQCKNVDAKDFEANQNPHYLKFKYNGKEYIIKVNDIVTYKNNWKQFSRVPRKNFIHIRNLLIKQHSRSNQIININQINSIISKHEIIYVSLSGNGNVLAIADINNVVNIYHEKIHRCKLKNFKFINDSKCLSLSNDGNILVIGSPGDNSFYLYKYKKNPKKNPKNPKNKWTLIHKIYGHINSLFGYSVKMSGDGNIVAIGAPNNDDFIGAVYVYNIINDTITLDNKLVGNKYIGKPRIGYTIDMSPNGYNILVSGVDDDDKGAIWMFNKLNDSWNVSNNPLICRVSDNSKYGHSICI
jgi:hypothetical protein